MTNTAGAPGGPPTPSDNTTLLAVLTSYEEAGYSGQFIIDDDGDVRCAHCRNDFPPKRLVMHSLRRLEGASDPADMLAVMAVSCPACGTKGTLIANYGPEGSEADDRVLSAVQDERDDSSMPRDVAPGEAGSGPTRS